MSVCDAGVLSSHLDLSGEFTLACATCAISHDIDLIYEVYRGS